MASRRFTNSSPENTVDELMKFDPYDPFPLLPIDSLDAASAQTHSEQVDLWLGFNTFAVESSILQKLFREAPESRLQKSDEELWIGLPVRALLTPYTELRALLAQLNPKPGDTVVDLGAGYGRMAFVVERHFSQVNFIGYECVPERLAEACRVMRLWRLERSSMLEVDLTLENFKPASALFYFIYDFGTARAIDKTLRDLEKMAQFQKIAVVARGTTCRNLIEHQHSWLRSSQGECFLRYSIYKSSEPPRADRLEREFRAHMAAQRIHPLAT